MPGSEEAAPTGCCCYWLDDARPWCHRGLLSGFVSELFLIRKSSITCDRSERFQFFPWVQFP